MSVLELICYFWNIILIQFLLQSQRNTFEGIFITETIKCLQKLCNYTCVVFTVSATYYASMQFLKQSNCR